MMDVQKGGAFHVQIRRDSSPVSRPEKAPVQPKAAAGIMPEDKPIPGLTPPPNLGVDSPQFQTEEEMVVLSKADIRKRLAALAHKAKKFALEWQYPDRQEIDVSVDSNGIETPEGIKYYNEELARRQKEDEHIRPAQRSAYFQAEFADLPALLQEVSNSWPGAELKALTNQCDPVPPEIEMLWAMNCADALDNIARKIRD